MDTCFVVSKDAAHFENSDDISSSIVQKNSGTSQDRSETDNLPTKDKSEELMLESSAMHNDSNISDAFLSELLSISPSQAADNSVKEAITLNPDDVEKKEASSTETRDSSVESSIVDEPAVMNPDDVEKKEASSTETRDSPVESNIVDEPVVKISSAIGDITHDPEGNASVKPITDAQSSEELSIKILADPLKNGYRCQDEAWSEDDESSSTSSDSSSDSDTFFETMREGPGPKTTYPLMKTKGELDLEDLPLIEDLVISVEEKEMEKIGKVYAIVEKLVIIRALKDKKPLDLESVLFLSYDKPLGRVFDVFGPVVEPFYSVRFNSVEHIVEKDIKVDADVFFAPEKEDITSYVFVDDLQNQKGSDASWRHNNEPPDEFLDFSDDEQERAARRKRMVKNRNKGFNNSADVAPKKPLLTGNTPDNPIYVPPRRPTPRRNIHSSTVGYYRPNPFSTPRPILSSTPSIHRVMMSPAPSPYGIPQHSQIHLPFSIQSPPPPLPYQQPPLPYQQPPLPYQQHSMLQRHAPSPLMFAAHQQPVFGQVAMLSPALHTPSPFPPTIISNVPSLIPASHLSPVNAQNYFNQGFSRSPSPALQNGSPMSPDPWLPNRAPYMQSNLPPNAPLTVQIPPNIGNPSLPVHHFDQVNGSVQQFVNHQNIHFRPPYVNQQNMNFPNSNVRPRFY